MLICSIPKVNIAIHPVQDCNYMVDQFSFYRGLQIK